MARRQDESVRIFSGVLNVRKSQHMTSHDVVAIVRRQTGIKRVGHTGTLDPMATGVLPVCIGNATRIIEYLDYDIKTYECSMRLGLRTDTEDIWGEVTKENHDAALNVSKEELIDAIGRFEGDILQVPPMYSALKVNGRKLYEYARKGENVEIKERPVHIFGIRILSLNIPDVTFEVRCSKGTYIRSLCRDIGEVLGCGAVMTGLVRTKTGAFDISDSVDIERIKELSADEIEALTVPAGSVLSNLKKGIVKKDRAEWFMNGGWLCPDEVDIVFSPDMCGKYDNRVRLYDDERFLGIAFCEGEEDMLKPDKVFK